MGLDMYLTRRLYVRRDDRKKLAIIGVEQHVNESKVKEIVEEVAEWRKANAIHQWFVDNVQHGDDDCKEHYVSKGKLLSLLFLVKEVLEASELIEADIQSGTTFKNGKEVPIMEKGKKIKNPKVAMELLPTQEGFFFGSQGYDQWYVEDLEYTKKVLEDAVADDEGDYYYSSSW